MSGLLSSPVDFTILRAMAASRLPSRLVLPALGVAVLAGAALALSGLGYRWGMWSVPVAFTIMRSVVFAGAVAAALAAAGLMAAVRFRRWRLAAAAVAALLMGLLSVAVPLT